MDTYTLEKLRECVRRGARGWDRINPTKGPCGAIAQAQIIMGFGSSLHWCETSDDCGITWFSHWFAMGFDWKGSTMKCDLSGCYTENPQAHPYYRRVTRREIFWPNGYENEDILFWVKRFRNL